MMSAFGLLSPLYREDVPLSPVLVYNMDFLRLPERNDKKVIKDVRPNNKIEGHTHTLDFSLTPTLPPHTDANTYRHAVINDKEIRVSSESSGFHRSFAVQLIVVIVMIEMVMEGNHNGFKVENDSYLQISRIRLNPGRSCTYPPSLPSYSRTS